jgi:hypothetical protein
MYAGPTTTFKDGGRPAYSGLLSFDGLNQSRSPLATPLHPQGNGHTFSGTSSQVIQPGSATVGQQPPPGQYQGATILSKPLGYSQVNSTTNYTLR